MMPSVDPASSGPIVVRHRPARSRASSAGTRRVAAPLAAPGGSAAGSAVVGEEGDVGGVVQGGPIGSRLGDGLVIVKDGDPNRHGASLAWIHRLSLSDRG